jgi:hypothetical protein
MHGSRVLLLSVCATLGAACGGGGTDPGSADGAAGDTGSIAIEASVKLVDGPFVCPAIASFSITPAAAVLNQAAQLGIVTVGPSPSTIHWSVSPSSGGVFSDPSSPSPVFRCESLGVMTISVQVGVVDPNLGSVCVGVAGTSYSGTIRCEAGP